MAGVPEFHLETPRLILKFLDPDNNAHCVFIVRLFSEPLFVQYEGKSGLDTVAKASAFIRNRCLYQYRDDHYGRCIMYLKPEGQTSPSLSACCPIGLISMVKGTDENCYTVPDIGFSVLEEFNGKGYATEGAKAMVDYVTNQLSIDGVLAFADQKNVACHRVLQKLGFEDRGMRKLKTFGPEATGLVFAKHGMKEDLGVYNLRD